MLAFKHFHAQYKQFKKPVWLALIFTYKGKWAKKDADF